MMRTGWPKDEHVKTVLALFVVAGFVFGLITNPPPSAETARASASAQTSENTAVENETNTIPTSDTTTRTEESAVTPTSQTMTDATTTTDGSAQTGLAYVALGDSVASGAGLAPSATATTEDEICDRSPLSYPYKVAEGLGTSVTHLACSGAKLDEGIYGEQRRQGADIVPQLDAAFTEGTPDIITMTIGANDVRWTSFIRQCYVIRCGSTVDDARAKVYRADLRIELYRALNQIDVRSENTPPRVLLSGYYTPFADLSCVPTNRITSAEQTWLQEQTDELNQAIQSVIPYFPFAEYVPVDFSGHELCAADSWLQGVNDDAPFHPTDAGQTAIAESFLTRLQR